MSDDKIIHLPAATGRKAARYVAEATVHENGSRLMQLEPPPIGRRQWLIDLIRFSGADAERAADIILANLDHLTGDPRFAQNPPMSEEEILKSLQDQLDNGR